MVASLPHVARLSDRPAQAGGTLRVGTSGFAYPRWAPAFYPAGTRGDALLPAYAARLAAVELSTTYYRQPSVAQAATWATRTPPTFRFSVKLLRAGVAAGVRGRGGRGPGVAHGAPGRLRRSAGDGARPHPRRSLARRRAPGGAAGGVAQAGAAGAGAAGLAWHVDEVFAVAGDFGAVVVCTETDDAPDPPLNVTGPFIYLRLRRERYGTADLDSWAARLEPFLADGRDAFVFFRHDDAWRDAGLRDGARRAAPRVRCRRGATAVARHWEDRSMTATIRVGLVGAGGIARSRHVPGLRAIEGVEITGVVARSAASTRRAADELAIPTAYPSWEDLVADPAIDAVVVATWPYLHAPVTIAALQAGRHVLCEGRMAMNADEARAMLAASLARPDRVAMLVPGPFSFFADAAVRRLLDEGAIGTPRTFRATWAGAVAPAGTRPVAPREALQRQQRDDPRDPLRVRRAMARPGPGGRRHAGELRAVAGGPRRLPDPGRCRRSRDRDRTVPGGRCRHVRGVRLRQVHAAECGLHLRDRGRATRRPRHAADRAEPTHDRVAEAGRDPGPRAGRVARGGGVHRRDPRRRAG